VDYSKEISQVDSKKAAYKRTDGQCAGCVDIKSKPTDSQTTVVEGAA